MPLGRKTSSLNTTKHGGEGSHPKIEIDQATDMDLATSLTEYGDAKRDEVFEHKTKNTDLPSNKDTEKLSD